MTDKRTGLHGATGLLTSAGVAACVLFGYGDAFGAPTGGEVTGGTGTISQPNATTTRIDQTSNKLAIDWQTFNVAANEKVQFVQPSTQAIALNRILDQKASQIFGAIDANGRVFLINPNGVVFGRDSHINVAGLVASSLDMSSADFMDGHYSLEARAGGEGGLVANHGVIETTPGGFVVLTGGAVINDGVVLAELGSITLAAGHKATLDFQGDGMLLFEVDQGLSEKLAGVDAAVTNSGELIANGGRILLTAQAASDVYSRVVNNEGIARANRIDDSGGMIRLIGSGGETNSSGLLDASGAAGSSGGTVEVLGDNVAVSGQINADASGTGNGGSVTLLASDTTTFTGQISARGGETAGDGGFAEVSGQHLLVSGHADLTAANGDSGGLLLDPGSVAIVDGANTAPGVALDTFNDAWIASQLGLGDVTISTANSTNAAAEDITVAGTVSIDWGNNNNNVLTLSAGHDLALGGTFNTRNQGQLNLLFGQQDLGGTLTLGSATLNGTLNVVVTGGAGVDILQGADADTTWDVTANNAGTMTGTGGATVAFTAVDVLQGGTGGDTFNLDGDIAANGGTGIDAFNLTSGAGDIAGEGGSDTVTAAGDFTIAGTGGGTASGRTFATMETLSGTGANTLTGPNANTTWNVSSNNTGTTTGGATIAFNGIDTLQGGTAIDTFNLSGNIAANGGNGNDVFHQTSGTGALAGEGGNDTLTGPNAATTWAVTANDAGTITSGTARTFTTIENLTGNAGVDQFTFTAALTGTASGLGGNDTFTVNDGGSAGTFDGGANGGAPGDTLTYAGSTGPVTISLTDLVGIETLVGSASANDVLQGTAGADTFTTSGTNAGTVGGVTYSLFENLDGLGGADIFNLNNNVTGDVAGGGGADTFNLAAAAAIGGTLSGGTESDTLVAVGGAGPNVWAVNAADAGTLNGRGFTGMENLTGNANVDQFTFAAALTGTASGLGGNDTFTVNDGGSAGTFDGGTNTGGNGNTLTYAGSTGPVTISLTDLIGIQTLVGSASANDVLQGTAGADTFTTSGTNAGTVGGVKYSLFENLDGLGGNDIFNLNNNVTGNVFGGAGDDTFNLAAGAAIGGTLVGGSDPNNVEEAVDMLVAVGGAGPNVWNVTAPDAGTLDGRAFAGIGYLIGNANVDQFTFTAHLTGFAEGLGGDDVFAINDGGSGGMFDGGAGNDTITYAGSTGPVFVQIHDSVGIENLVGSPASDVLIGMFPDTFTTSGFGAGTVTTGTGPVTYSSFENLDGGNGATLANDTAYTITGRDSGTSNSATTWSNMANLIGTGGADTFTFAPGGSLTNGIDGLGGTDTADYSLNPQTVALGATLQNIEILKGGGAGFTLTGGSVWTITGADSGTVDGITFTNWANVTGTAGANTFTVAGGTLSGTADGAGGNDTLSGDTAYTVTGANSGTGVAVAAWSNIENLTGTGGADTFTVAGGALTGAVNGLGGIDSLSGNTTYTISGPDRGTANAVATWSNIENLAGTGGADTFTVAGGTLSGNADGAAGNDKLVGATTYSITGPNSGTSNVVATWTNIENLTGTGGADTFTIVSGGSLGGTMDGLAGNDKLTGPNAATTWDVTGTGAGSLSGGTTGAFNSIETLQGDASADTFNLGGTVVANGGDGDDVFNLTSGTGAIAGEAGNDTVAASGNFTIVGTGGGTAAGRTFSTMELLSGTGLNDTIAGPAGASVWSLSGQNGGSVTGGAVIAFDGIDAIHSGGAADAFNLDPTFHGSMTIDGSPTSTMTIASNGSPGDSWIFDSFDTVDFGPGTVLNLSTFSLTSAVTRVGTGTAPLVWTVGMDVTLGGTATFFLGNSPPLPFTDANGASNPIIGVLVALNNAALNDNALSANNNAVEEVDWAQFDPNLRLFDVNNPGVKLPADQVVDELALFWFDDGDDDEIDIAQAITPRTLVGLESRRN